MRARFGGARTRRTSGALAGLLVVVGVTAAPALGAPIGWTQRTFAGADNIYSIDAATGATTLIGATGIAGGNTASALAAAPDGTLYATATDNNFYRIDPATAAPTLVGPLGVGLGGFAPITVTGDGQIWMAYSDLYRINPSTGAATLVGSLGGSPPFAAGLAGTCDGRLFAVLTNNTLVSINPATGAATLIGSTFPAPPGFSGMPIAFDANETLRGVNSIFNTTFDFNVYTIDLTSGAATAGPTTQSDQNTIAFPHPCPAAAPVAATPVPATIRFTG